MMYRIRSIHGELWTDEEFVACSPLARLLSIALWNVSDDQGVFEWKPKALKMRCLPADNCDINQLLDELCAARRIVQFEFEGRIYGLVRNFGRFQRPRKLQTRYPKPPSSLLDAAKVRTDESDGEGIGEERKVEDANASSREAIVDDEIRELASSLGVNPDAELLRFTDWKAANGRKFKNDRAAFRNWLRKAAEIAPARSKPPNGSTPPMQYNEPWPQRLRRWRNGTAWDWAQWGPSPGEPGCRVPPHLLEAA